jgi:putative transposase
LSVRFTTGATGCETKHAAGPRLGQIKLHEDASRLVDKVDVGSARVISAAAGFERGRWFVSFTVDAQRPVLTPASPDAVVGVDLGVKTLAVLSTGQEFANPRHSGGAARKVRHLNRTVSRRVGPYDNATRKRRDPSNRWRRASVALAKA